MPLPFGKGSSAALNGPPSVENRGRHGRCGLGPLGARPQHLTRVGSHKKCALQSVKDTVHHPSPTAATILSVKMDFKPDIAEETFLHLNLPKSD